MTNPGYNEAVTAKMVAKSEEAKPTAREALAVLASEVFRLSPADALRLCPEVKALWDRFLTNCDSHVGQDPDCPCGDCEVAWPFLKVEKPDRLPA